MSYGGNADPSGIQVTFLDQTGAKSVKAQIAYSVPVSRILPNIITKMNLPVSSPDGQPMSYSLDHKEGGRRLIESQTLVEAGVQLLRIDQQADLDGLTSEQPTETRVEPTHYGPLW